MVYEEGKTKSRLKLKRKNFFKNFSYYFTEYCDNTSIHGFKFFGERGRFIVEKLWWLIFVGISLYFCVMLISQTYYKWMNAPVIVSFATSETPLWKIPFPAVTVCPLTKTEKSKFDFEYLLNLKENHTDFDEEEATQFDYMSLVCSRTLNTILNENSSETVHDSVNTFLMEVSPNFQNTIHMCKWVGKNCTNLVFEYFTPILTSFGVCYTFNMLDRNDIFTKEAALDYYESLSVFHQPKAQWSLEKGYFDKSPLDTFPRRTILTGTTGGLELIFQTSEQDMDYHCEESLRGYKVILHHPAEIPRSHQNYFWVPLNQLVSVSVKPNMMTTAEELQRYDPDARKCCFYGERKLRFFKAYNQQNCFLECLANYTYKQCKCVAFYMPRDGSTPICGPAKVSCIYKANVDFLTAEADLQMKTEEEKEKETVGPMLTTFKPPKSVKSDCHCLPSCNSLHYDPETSQLDWDWRKGNILNDEDENITYHLSRLRIFFKDYQFMTSQRNELYGQTEFWANCGGILGLFTGFSFISLIEIVYFATLRFACNVKKYGWSSWSGAREFLEAKTDV